jgi:hypothetical protein
VYLNTKTGIDPSPSPRLIVSLMMRSTELVMDAFSAKAHPSRKASVAGEYALEKDLPQLWEQAR